jgi:hypothetical protein
VILFGFLTLVVLLTWIQSVSTRLYLPASSTKQNVLPTEDDGTTAQVMTLTDRNMDEYHADIREFTKIVQTLRGQDKRLVQWDATEHTVQQQAILCPSRLPLAMKYLISSTTLLEEDNHHQIQSNTSANSLVVVLQLALEICTLCITDHPENRAIFSDGNILDGFTHTGTIHNAVVRLLHISTLTSYAAHLIYIASFANRNNYDGFVNANAVSILCHILIDATTTPTTTTPAVMPTTAATLTNANGVMWVAAALQNLAASYCTTEDDGRCYWEWKQVRHSINHINESRRKKDRTTMKEKYQYKLQLSSDSGTMVIDGTNVRQQMIAIPNLMDRLVQWTCYGPVNQKMSLNYPYPGHNAIYQYEPHESSASIVPWAITGVLKNLLVDTTVRDAFITQYSWSTSCFCYISKSNDWLEANKGEGALHHLRIDSDPCWFHYQSSKYKKKKAKLCVDQIFVDASGNTCEEYNDEETLTKDDCAAPDTIRHGVVASDACCQCGGGDCYNRPADVKDNELLHK